MIDGVGAKHQHHFDFEILIKHHTISFIMVVWHHTIKIHKVDGVGVVWHHRPLWFIPPVPGNYENTTFGKKTEKSENAAGTVNPNKSAVEVANEEKMGHKNYVKTHHDYYVGEQINRNYFQIFLNKYFTFYGV